MTPTLPPPRRATLASRLTAGCVTLVVVLAAVGAVVGWWWKLRATARERGLRAPVTAPAAAPIHSPPVPAGNGTGGEAPR
jgi:hypothetical protein